MKRRTLLRRAAAGTAGAGLLAGCLGRRDAPGNPAGEPDEGTTTDDATPDSTPTDGTTTRAGDEGSDDRTDSDGGADGDEADETTAADDDPDGHDDDPPESDDSDGGASGDEDDGSSGTDDLSGTDSDDSSETDSDGDSGDEEDSSDGEDTERSGDGGAGAPLASGVRDRAIESQGQCLTAGKSPGDATVEFEGDRVLVGGDFQTPDPCFWAHVARSSHEGGVYEVVVDANEMTDENGDPVVCQQCVGVIEYDATVLFADPPDRVVVRHGPETVADETR